MRRERLTLKLSCEPEPTSTVALPPRAVGEVRQLQRLLGATRKPLGLPTVADVTNGTEARPSGFPTRTFKPQPLHFRRGARLLASTRQRLVRDKRRARLRSERGSLSARTRASTWPPTPKGSECDARSEGGLRRALRRDRERPRVKQRLRPRARRTSCCTDSKQQTMTREDEARPEKQGGPGFSRLGESVRATPRCEHGCPRERTTSLMSRECPGSDSLDAPLCRARDGRAAGTKEGACEVRAEDSTHEEVRDRVRFGAEAVRSILCPRGSSAALEARGPFFSTWSKQGHASAMSADSYAAAKNLINEQGHSPRPSSKAGSKHGCDVLCHRKGSPIEP